MRMKEAQSGDTVMSAVESRMSWFRSAGTRLLWRLNMMTASGDEAGHFGDWTALQFSLVCVCVCMCKGQGLQVNKYGAPHLLMREGLRWFCLQLHSCCVCANWLAELLVGLGAVMVTHTQARAGVAE